MKRVLLLSAEPQQREVKISYHDLILPRLTDNRLPGNIPRLLGVPFSLSYRSSGKTPHTAPMWDLDCCASYHVSCGCERPVQIDSRLGSKRGAVGARAHRLLDPSREPTGEYDGVELIPLQLPRKLPCPADRCLLCSKSVLAFVALFFDFLLK